MERRVGIAVEEDTSWEEGKTWMEEGRLERGVAKGSRGASIEVWLEEERVRLEWPIRNRNPFYL
jgi:hypothetical protein